ncbi:hypothetical protein ACA910_013010 [Epithemia clementina (nom. ined.)]
MVNFERSRDLYKVLQVPHTASIADIKASYRKLALRLHPDMHKDDPAKTAEFKSVSEAYSILSDVEKKNSYDFKLGIRYNKNRRTPPPPDYRSVKFPPKPKHWKTVWDHQTHYDMHYGDGMYNEVLRQARKRAEAEGFDYRSPLGPGFSFSSEEPEQNSNPFSRSSRSFNARRSARRGFSLDYEEGHVHMDGRNQQQQRTIYRHAKENLHGSRQERHEEYLRQKEELRKARQNAAFRPAGETCVIL